MFHIRQTATNYLQFIDFSKYRDELMLAAHENDLDYIAEVIAQVTGDPWTAEEGTKYSLAGSSIFRYGENKPEYFTFRSYGEVITISIDAKHHTFSGYLNLQMSLLSLPKPTPIADLIKADKEEI